MATSYNISIVNGIGTEQIVNGTYSVTVDATGYDPTTLVPATETVTDERDTYPFTVAATGTLTLHVTETGAPTIPIVGAMFRRCDSAGTQYGNPITTDSNGQAQFLNVPFAATGAPNIYFKQLISDDDHNYDEETQSTSMATVGETFEVYNEPASPKTVTLRDANYTGLPVDAATITFS